MIYLTTGGNGASKTLFTIWDVRQAQLKDPSRPVYYHGFKPLQAIHDFGWLPFEPDKWQDLPDGSICIFDECQNEMPAKIEGKLPEWINAIAQHRRRRGFDFWLITPHPTLIHINVRRLIESPSWHRHIKRIFGTETANHLTFNYCETKCEQPGSAARGETQVRAFPKEAYAWYESATKHTGKKRIPKQVFVLAGAVAAVPVFAYFAWSAMSSTFSGDDSQSKPSAAASGVSSAPMSAAVNQSMTVAQYVQSFQPRLPGFPNTAARYDEVTKPVTAPYPAACVQSKRGCICYTQQATRLTVPLDVCQQIVQNGYFIDWNTASPGQAADFTRKDQALPSQVKASASAILAPPADATATRVAASDGSLDGQVIAAMRRQ